MEMVIENIVASAALGKRIDLNKLYKEMHKTLKANEEIAYEPERFSGLVFKVFADKSTSKKKISFLVFPNGAVIASGIKSVSGIAEVKPIIEKMGRLGEFIVQVEVEEKEE